MINYSQETNTCIRNALLDFALPGVFLALFLTDFNPSELDFSVTGVATKFLFCADAFKFSFVNGELISLIGVCGRNETDNAAEGSLLGAIGLSGTSDSRIASSSGGFVGLKRMILGLGEGSVAGRNRLLTWRDEEEDGVWERGRFLGGVSTTIPSIARYYTDSIE